MEVFSCIIKYSCFFDIHVQKFRQKKHLVNRITAAGEVVHYGKVSQTAKFSRVFRCISKDSPEKDSAIEVSCINVTLHSGKSTADWKISFSEMKKITFEQ